MSPYSLSAHAILQAQRREVPLELVLAVANHPEQEVLLEVAEKVVVHQSIVSGRLIRVFINPETQVIITVYRTSQIEKYWQSA